MSSFVWPNEDGWPYPDGEADVVDPVGIDDDAVALHVAAPGLLSGLDPLEREVIAARFGLDGARTRTMKQLHRDLGVARADLRDALGSGLAKLRTTLG